MPVIVAAATAATFAPASAAVGPSAPPVQQPHVIDLHAAFERALPDAATGPRAGVVPGLDRWTGASTGTGATARPGAASKCTEPECDLSYGGGAVQHTPHVYLLLWGPNWSESASTPVVAYLTNFYKGLGVSPEDTWSTITSQYTGPDGAPTFGGSVFVGSYQDTGTPPNPVTPDDLAAEADALVASQDITDVADAQIVVASQSGTCFSDGFVGSCGQVNSSGTGYCGWHSITSDNVPYINLPYLLDAGEDCGENFINSGSAGTYDGFSMIGGHEYAETITDPNPFTGWSDPADTISDGGAPGEIADKCAWGGGNFGLDLPDGDVTLSTGRFAMQSLWSNAAGQCVMTASPSLTVTNPGTQASTLGNHVSVRVRASTNTDTPLSFTASGLPPGLAIGGSSGVISGRPGTTAGTWHPTVTVRDYAGTSRVSFSWLTSSRPGQIKGYASRCVDDFAGRKTNGNKIDVWSCDGLARQRITFTASGELQLEGKCVTAHRSAVLETCTAASDQVWRRHSNGEYVVGSSGRCLSDPRDSTADGTQLTLAACKDTPAQRWPLP